MSIIDRIRAVGLSRGSHSPTETHGCVMEWTGVAYLMENRGFDFNAAWARLNDQPICTHSMISAFAQSINDRTDDEARQSLIDFIPRLAGAHWTYDQWRQSRVDSLCVGHLFQHYAPTLLAGNPLADELSAIIDRYVEWSSLELSDYRDYDQLTRLSTIVAGYYDNPVIADDRGQVRVVMDLLRNGAADAAWSLFHWLLEEADMGARFADLTEDDVETNISPAYIQAGWAASERAGIAFLDVLLDVYDKARAHHGTLADPVPVRR